jgi:hypothetical protein
MRANRETSHGYDDRAASLWLAFGVRLGKSLDGDRRLFDRLIAWDPDE